MINSKVSTKLVKGYKGIRNTIPLLSSEVFYATLILDLWLAAMPKGPAPNAAIPQA